MAKSINKFIVKLTDLSEFKPKLLISVSPVKEKKQTYNVKVIHPNPKLGEDGKPLLIDNKKVQDIVYQEEYKSKEKDVILAISEAINYGKTVLLERPDIQEIARNTKYIEQLFIPQGRRGRMKLKTKDSVKAEAKAKIALEASEEMDDLDMDLEMDEVEEIPTVKTSKKPAKAKKIKEVKVVEKVATKPATKATKKVVKKATKVVKSTTPNKNKSKNKKIEKKPTKKVKVAPKKKKAKKK